MRMLWLALAIGLFFAGCGRVHAAEPTVRTSLPPGEIVVYVRTGCPYCERVLDLLSENDIIPTVRNVKTDRQAYQELLAIYREHFPDQKIIVPVIVRDGEYLRGFNRQSITELLNRAPFKSPEDDEARD